MEQFRYGVAWKEYPFKREYIERGMSSAEYEHAEDKWLQLTRSISKKRQSDHVFGSARIIKT